MMKFSIFYEHIKEAVEQSKKNEEKILSFVKKFGIAGIEICFSQLKNDFSIFEKLKSYNFEISCIYEFYSWSDMEDFSKLKNHIEMSEKVCAKKILIVPPFLEENKNVFMIEEFLKKAVEIASSKNITVTLEDFDNEKSPCAKISQLKNFFTKIPGLKCTFDLGNFAFSDENVLDAFDELKDFIFHVHCKDRGYENGINLQNNKGLASVPTGFGYLPIKELILKILDTGYDDYFAIEHFNAYDQLDYIKKSSEFLNEIKQTYKKKTILEN